MLYGILVGVYVLFAVSLIVTVLLQSGRSAGLSGAIAGGAEQFFGKRKGMDELLGKLSTISAAAFIILSLVLTIMSRTPTTTPTP